MQFTIHEAPAYVPPQMTKNHRSGAGVFFLGLLMGAVGCGLAIVAKEDITKKYQDADRPPVSSIAPPASGGPSDESEK